MTYVEGFGLTQTGLVHAHAWCTDDQGQVHDPTWPDGAAVSYLGVPFAAAYVATFDEQFGDARLLHDCHLDDCRLLRHGLPPDAIAMVGDPAGRIRAGRR